MGIAHANGLCLAGIFAIFGGQGDAAGDENSRHIMLRGQGDQHGRQPLVTSGNPHDPLTRRQGAHQAAQDQGGVIAIGQAVKHAGCPLAAAIAGVGDKAGKGDGAFGGKLFGGGLHEQAHFPVAGVVAQRNRCAIGGADAALGAEDEKLLAAEHIGIPAHAHILAHGKEIAARGVE